eukprot:731084-Hanusia_phi.AAC.1
MGYAKRLLDPARRREKHTSSATHTSYSTKVEADKPAWWGKRVDCKQREQFKSLINAQSFSSLKQCAATLEEKRRGLLGHELMMLTSPVATNRKQRP